MKKPIYRGICLKIGVWIVCRFNGGGGREGKKEGNALYVRF